MNDEEIIEEFGCVKPCTYMEYKVYVSSLLLCEILISYFQLPDDPVTVKTPNETVVGIKFDSPNVLAETEDLAYSESSLVADCGGVLGLFVGFNFLMIWDFLCYAFQKLRPHCKPNKA